MVKKYFSKSAFTLPEILMTMCIIGIILVSMLQIVKVNENVLPLQYVNAYNTVATASYNIYERIALKNNLTTQYVGEDLCKYMAYYINNASGSSNGDEDGTCSTVTLLDFKLTSPITKSVDSHFVASNGMKFYFSNETNEIADLGVQSIVWVDINGDKGPNTSVWNENKPADIVPFGVNETGEVYPLGYPKYDTRYMRARIIYDVRTEMNEGVPAYSYYVAQRKAFGNKIYKSDHMSYRYDETDAFKDAVFFVPSDRRPSTSQDSNCATQNDFAKCSIEITK